MRQGFVKSNPAIGTENPIRGKAPRDRVLADAELKAIWKNCLDDDFGRIVRLLLLTACRRDEIGGLRWNEIDLVNCTLKLPKERTKSKRVHELTLPKSAITILESVRRLNSRETLFGGGASGYCAWSYGSLQIAKRMAESADMIAAWRLHDIRRTVRTRMGKLGVLPHVAELVLNHAGHKSGIGGVYDHHDYAAEKADALRKWELHLLGIVSPAGQ